MKVICPICKERITVKGKRHRGRLKSSLVGKEDPREEIAKYILKNGCKICFLDGKRVPGHKPMFGERR